MMFRELGSSHLPEKGVSFEERWKNWKHQQHEHASLDMFSPGEAAEAGPWDAVEPMMASPQARNVWLSGNFSLLQQGPKHPKALPRAKAPLFQSMR